MYFFVPLFVHWDQVQHPPCLEEHWQSPIPYVQQLTRHKAEEVSIIRSKLATIASLASYAGRYIVVVITTHYRKSHQHSGQRKVVLAGTARLVSHVQALMCFSVLLTCSINEHRKAWVNSFSFNSRNYWWVGHLWRLWLSDDVQVALCRHLDKRTL